MSNEPAKPVDRIIWLQDGPYVATEPVESTACVIDAKARPEQPNECPTCAPIIQAVAQAIATAMPSAPTKPSDALPPCRPRTHNQYTAVSGTAVGIGERIRTVLRTAGAPMSTGEIAEAGGVPAKKVATNIPHLCFKGDVIRVGEPVYKIGYRYWLKARTLPEGVSA